MSYPGPGFNFESRHLQVLATLQNFEIGGAPTKFKVFKVGASALTGARNFENFEIDGAPTKFKVFKVGPSARGPL